MSIFDLFKRSEKGVGSSTIGTNSPSPFSLFLNQSGYVFAIPRFSLQQVIDNFRQVAPLNNGVMRIAEAVGSLPIALRNVNTGELITEHPLLDLMWRPNVDMQRTKFDFLRDMVIWKFLDGDAYVKIAGQINREPTGLYVLDPKYVTSQAGSRGFADSYRYGNVNQYEEFKRDPKTQRFISPDNRGELYHDRAFNPEFNTSNLRGMGKIEALQYEIFCYLEATKHNLGLLVNGARPSGALILKDAGGNAVQLDDASFSRIKKQLEDSFSGAVNAGRPMILEGGMEWKEMSINPKDMEFVANKKDAEKQIYNLLGVPLELISSEAATYNNKREARLYFYEATVLPLASDMLDRLDDVLLPRYKDGANLELVVNLDEVEALSIKREARRKSIEESLVMTLEEKRRELGLEELANSKVIMNATGFVTLDFNEGQKPASTAPDQSSNFSNADPANPEAKTYRFVEVKSIESELMAVIEEIDSPTVYAQMLPVASSGMREIIEAFGETYIEEVSADARFAVTTAMKDYADRNAAEMISNVTATTKKRLKEILSNDISEGAGLATLSSNMLNAFPDDISDSRVATIAVTESTKLATFAANEALAQAGVTEKEWLSVQDGNTRDTHSGLDGQRVKTGERFTAFNGATADGPGMFGIAEEDINCRCTVIGAFTDKMDGEMRRVAWKRREDIREQRQKMLQRTIFNTLEIQRRFVRDKLKKL